MISEGKHEFRGCCEYQDGKRSLLEDIYSNASRNIIAFRNYVYFVNTKQDLCAIAIKDPFKDGIVAEAKGIKVEDFAIDPETGDIFTFSIFGEVRILSKPLQIKVTFDKMVHTCLKNINRRLFAASWDKYKKEIMFTMLYPDLTVLSQIYVNASNCSKPIFTHSRLPNNGNSSSAEEASLLRYLCPCHGHHRYCWTGWREVVSITVS